MGPTGSPHRSFKIDNQFAPPRPPEADEFGLSQSVDPKECSESFLLAIPALTFTAGPAPTLDTT